jgi:hypothetical protein
MPIFVDDQVYRMVALANRQGLFGEGAAPD